LIFYISTMGINYFDPTCKVRPDDSDVDIYKRLVVNTNCVKPVLYSSPKIDDGIAPPYFTKGEWFFPAEAQILFEGV